MNDITVVLTASPSIVVTVNSPAPVPVGSVVLSRPGIQGFTGPQGPQGTQGIQGPQGPKGDTGLTGPQGERGPQGDSGPQGVQGIQGVQGPAGPTGPQGPQGVQGEPGGIGDKGPTGDKGPDGDTGPKGSAGDKGQTGDKGPTGDKGLTGDKGPIGDKGPSGDQGVVGNQGPTGDAGPQGIQGVQGPVGDKGADGDKGPAGDKGPVGDKGPAGDPGTVTFPDVIDVTAVATPAAPTTGKLKLFARTIAGRTLLNQIGPSGLDSPLQPALFGNQVYLWVPSNTTTVSIAFGTLWSARNATGAQSHAIKSTAGFINQMARALFSSTTAANTSSGIQSTQTVAARGNAANIGGFTFFARFGMETLAGTGQQVFVGLSALNAALGGEPSAQNNSIGVFKNSTDTTWKFMSRNASETTPIDTEVTITAGQVFDLTMFCKPGDTQVTVRLVRQNDGLVLMDDVIVTDTLPVDTVFMYAHAQIRNTGTAINALALNRIYVECDH